MTNRLTDRDGRTTVHMSADARNMDMVCGRKEEEKERGRDV